MDPTSSHGSSSIGSSMHVEPQNESAKISPKVDGGDLNKKVTTAALVAIFINIVATVGGLGTFVYGVSTLNPHLALLGLATTFVTQTVIRLWVRINSKESDESKNAEVIHCVKIPVPTHEELMNAKGVESASSQ